MQQAVAESRGKQLRAEADSREHRRTGEEEADSIEEAAGPRPRLVQVPYT